jgi:hypothetical protein
MKTVFLFFSFLILIFSVGCGDVQTTNNIRQGSIRQPCYDDGTCDEGLTCVSEVCVDLSEMEDKDPVTNDEVEDTSDPDIHTEPDNEIVDEDNEPYDGCDTEGIGTNCSLDDECGKCNICISGKCSKGCESDDDCKMYTDLKCNKKLNRCLNIYASLQACSERGCPFGCCISEKGFTAVKCIYNQEVSKCGMCANGDIYMPERGMCIPAVCSPSHDICYTLNVHDGGCYECNSAELICEEVDGVCD